MNRVAAPDTDDEDSNGDEEGEDGTAATDPDDPSAEEQNDPYALPEVSDDEEEMAELRRQVLRSKPFANSAEASQDMDPKARRETVAAPEAVKDRGPSESESDNGEDAAFDRIMDSTPVTDRSGIMGRQRLNQLQKRGIPIDMF
jgi:pre-rRNA-processing protein TSR3